MKIKILHIQETIGGGGVERRRLSLAKHLSKDIFEQKFICTLAGRHIPDEIRAEGFEVIPIGKIKTPFDWKQHKKVQKIIKDYQPDIIHGAVFEGVTMAAINGWWKKVPVVIIEETSDPKNRSWKGNLLMIFFSKLADKVIGVSEAVTEEYLKSKLKLPDKKVILINNGVAMPRECNRVEIERAKENWEIEKNDFVIGTIGRMLDDSNKRFSDLIRAFAEFSKGKKCVKLLLVGEGREKVGYQSLVEELKITDKVIFAGYQSDVSLFYQLMDVFALVSRNESFGLVLAESMLNKLPVIATRVGGMKYIVDDGETGYLVEPFQVHQMTEKMEVLYQNQNLRNEMGEKGFEKAMSLYTETAYVKNVEQLYLKLLKQND